MPWTADLPYSGGRQGVPELCGNGACPGLENMSRRILLTGTILVSLIFVFVAARTVVGLNLELMEATGSGSPFSFDEWSLIVLAPILIITVCAQSYLLVRRT
jgi:hypothetical protein